MSFKIVIDITCDLSAEIRERFGIEYIQGFYFSKPLPEEELLPFVNQYNNSLDKEKKEEEK